MPRLSIIVPYTGHDEALEATVLSVLENRPHDVELIVVHQGDYQDPYHLAEDELMLLEATCNQPVGIAGNLGDASLSSLFNRALESVASPVVECLLPGIQVTSGWADSVLDWFDRDDVVAVTPALQCDSSASLSRYNGLDPVFSPRRHWKHLSRSGDHSLPTLAGSFLRTEFMRRLDGLLNVPREQAEAELGLAIQHLERFGITEPESILLGTKPIIEGRMGGYNQGHFAGQLAAAYTSLPNHKVIQSSLASRIGHLVGGLFSPSSVAERLGWVVGLTDRSLVATIEARIENYEASPASEAELFPFETERFPLKQTSQRAA